MTVVVETVILSGKDNKSGYLLPESAESGRVSTPLEALYAIIQLARRD
jgi:hypothetical protein